MHEWTAGGLSSVQDPGANQVNDCQLVMRLEAEEWVQWQPTEEGTFLCDPAYAVTVDPAPDSVATLALDADGVARKNSGG